MPWVRMDDKMIYHMKFMNLSLAASGLHTWGLCWTAHALQDGFVDENSIKRRWHTDPEVSAALDELLQPARPGLQPLWVRVDGGYQIHDFLAYNPSAEQVQARQEEISAVRALAGRKGGQMKEANRQAALASVAPALANKQTPSPEPNRTDPSRPVPSRPLSPSKELSPDSKKETDDKPPWSGGVAIAITDLSQEFGDQDHTTSNCSQSMRLLAQSGLPPDDFVSLIYQVRTEVRNAMAVRNKMAYFFKALRAAIPPTEGKC